MSTSPRPGQKQQQPHRSLLPKKIASAEFKESLAMNAAEDCLARNKNANAVFDAASVLAALSGGSPHGSSTGLADQQNSATRKADCESSGQKRQLRHTISQTDSKSNSTSNLSAMSSSQSGGKSNTDQRPAKKAKQSLKSDFKNQPSKKSKSTEKKSSSKRKASNHLPNDLPIAPKERHIPSYKKSSCALTFPEKLMSMLDYAEEMKRKCVEKGEDPEKYCLTWMPDGESFLVRDPTACAQNVFPMFFKMAKFTSITRKLYRWGFHQVERNDAGGTPLPPDAMIFANDFFKREARHEMANMRSTTAASQKRKFEATVDPNNVFIKEEANMDGETGDADEMVSFNLKGSPRGNGGCSSNKKEKYDGSATTSEAGSSEVSSDNSPKMSSTLEGEMKPAAMGAAAMPQKQESTKLTDQPQEQHQQQQLLEMILTACNGDLSKIDPNLLVAAVKNPSVLLRLQGSIGMKNNAPLVQAGMPKTGPSQNNIGAQNLQQAMPLMNTGVNPTMTMQQHMQSSSGFAAQAPFRSQNMNAPFLQQQQQQQQAASSMFSGGESKGFVLPGTNIVITPALMAQPGVQQLIYQYLARNPPNNSNVMTSHSQQQPMAGFQGMPSSSSIAGHDDKSKRNVGPSDQANQIPQWMMTQNEATPINITMQFPASNDGSSSFHNSMNGIASNLRQSASSSHQQHPTQAAAMAVTLAAQLSQGGIGAQQALATLMAFSAAALPRPGSQNTDAVAALNKKPESSPQISSVQQNPAAASLPVQPMQQMPTSAPSLGNLTAVLGPLLANLSPEQQKDEMIQMFRSVAESLEKEKVQSQENQIQSVLSMLQNHAATSSFGHQ